MFGEHEMHNKNRNQQFSENREGDASIFAFLRNCFFPLSVSVHAQDAIALEVYVMAVCQTLENAILNKVLRSLELEACSCRSRKTRDDI